MELLNTVNSVRVCLVWLLQVCMFREKRFFLPPQWLSFSLDSVCSAGHSSGLIRGGSFTTAFRNGIGGQVLLPVETSCPASPGSPHNLVTFRDGVDALS